MDFHWAFFWSAGCINLCSKDSILLEIIPKYLFNMNQIADSTDQRSILATLQNLTAEHFLTMVLPTHQSGPETRGDSIRFKNMVADATQLLSEQGIQSSEIDEWLSVVHLKIDDQTFWQHRTDGLLVVVTAADTHLVDLHHSPTADVVLSDAPYLTPLHLDLSSQQSMYVLGVTQQRAALWSFDGSSITEVACEPFPVTFDELVTERDPERS